MKICISLSGKTFDSLVDPRFGRCPYFLIVDLKDENKIEIVENSATKASRGAGISAAQLVADLGVEIIITGNIGPNALSVLQPVGVKIFQGVNITAKEAIAKFKKNELLEITAATGPGSRGQK